VKILGGGKGEFLVDNKMNCICDVLYEICGFDSMSEFERFQKYLANLVKEQELILIPSYRKRREKRDYTIIKEKFECGSCHQAWILAHPDPPASGSWRKFKPQSVRSALNRLLGFELDV
jgi:hypothetical protein